MRERPAPGSYTAGYVETRLEDAGRTLLALPWAGCFPAGLKAIWGDSLPRDPPRWAQPTAMDITDMDEALRWPALIVREEWRVLVQRRLLVVPDSDPPRYVWSWRKLQRSSGLHPHTLQNRWGKGIDTIVARLNRPGLCAAAGGRFGATVRGRMAVAA